MGNLPDPPCPLRPPTPRLVTHPAPAPLAPDHPQVASLKRLSKGSKVILLDRNGGTSKTVAKELAKRGFSRVFVIEGGFDGRNGWVSSKLLVKPVAGSASFAPLPNVARTIATRRALPSPSK